MLTERVAMTTAVCNELEGGGSYRNYRARALLGQLQRVPMLAWAEGRMA